MTRDRTGCKISLLIACFTASYKQSSEQIKVQRRHPARIPLTILCGQGTKSQECCPYKAYRKHNFYGNCEVGHSPTGITTGILAAQMPARPTGSRHLARTLSNKLGDHTAMRKQERRRASELAYP